MSNTRTGSVLGQIVQQGRVNPRGVPQPSYGGVSVVNRPGGNAPSTGPMPNGFLLPDQRNGGQGHYVGPGAGTTPTAPPAQYTGPTPVGGAPHTNIPGLPAGADPRQYRATYGPVNAQTQLQQRGVPEGADPRQYAATYGGPRGVNAQTPIQTPYNSKIFTSSHGSDASFYNDHLNPFVKTNAFTPVGEAPSWYKNLPGYVSTIPVMSSGGDVHMPAGTGNMATAQRIGQWQAQMGVGAMPMNQQAGVRENASRGGGQGLAGINWKAPIYFNPTTGQYTNSSMPGGPFRGNFPQVTGQAYLDLARKYNPNFNKHALGDRKRARLAAEGARKAGIASRNKALDDRWAAEKGQAQVSTTIQGDKPIYDQAFIQRLVNRAVEDTRLDPREAMKRFDIPGASRDEGQLAQAIPDLARARASGNRAMAQIPLQAELANRLYQLQGQEGRGQEALSLANLLLQLQRGNDAEHTNYLGAVLDPLVGLLARV